MSLFAVNTPDNYVCALYLGGALTFPCQLWLSKAGGAFAMSASVPTLIGNAGNYVFVKVPFSAIDTNTLGTMGLFLFDGVTAASPADLPQVVPSLPGELTNPERDAIAAAILGLSSGVDAGVSLAHALMAITAFLTGKTPSFGPITRYRNWADTKDRVTMTTDPVSGRLSVLFDFS